ncbi:hypothetical protein N7488_006994 [Penicillium malachiteum]|nr:hypothetical protein N7488_006994 [Penicillium malachiteum]
MVRLIDITVGERIKIAINKLYDFVYPKNLDIKGRSQDGEIEALNTVIEGWIVALVVRVVVLEWLCYMRGDNL